MGNPGRIHHASAVAAAFFLIGATAPEPPVFSFKGIVAGQPADTREVDGCRSDKPRCMVSFDLAGCATIGAIDFNNSMLASLYLMPRRHCMFSVFDAFTAKYGQPTASRIENWRNGAGASLDNQVMEWHFKTGVLTLKQFGYRLDAGSITYRDENQPPPKAPNVNF